ncbi:outer membrane protein [Methylobacterium sp. Gmos1]
MKSFLVVVPALAAQVAVASAADLPFREAVLRPALPVETVAGPDWTGVYVGAQVGAAVDGGFQGRTLAPLPAVSVRTSLGGFTGGGTVGFNYMLARDLLPGLFGGGGLVVGIEADGGYASFRSQTSVSVPKPGFSAEGGLGTDTYFATLRGRLGYAFGPLLVYATGGWAASEIGVNAGVTVPGFSVPLPVNKLPAGLPVDKLPFAIPSAVSFPGFSTAAARSMPVDGYVVGAGLEYAVRPNWTIKSEYLYADLDRTVTVRAGPYNARFNAGFDVHQLRIGVNHRLSWL